VSDGLTAWKSRAKSIGECVAKCESPIEALLLVALFADTDRFSTPKDADAPWLAMPQSVVRIGDSKYRLDIEVIGEGLRVAIETDGHDFHERTPEQVIRDNKRGRALEADQWHVVRFSGREVRRDPIGCATALVKLLDAWKPHVGGGDPLEQAIIAFSIAQDAEVRWGFAKHRGKPNEVG
jgi:hypothetical protein